MELANIIADLTKRVETLELLNRGSQKAYGQAYRTAAYSTAAANTFEALGMTGGNNNLINITHSTGTNPERLTIAKAGTYRITYSLIYAPLGIQVGYFKLFKNAATEIPGSYSNSVETTGTYCKTITKNCIVDLAAGDYIKLMVAQNAANACIGYFAGIGGTTDCATITIERIDA